MSPKNICSIEQSGQIKDANSLEIQCDYNKFKLHEFQSLHWVCFFT